MINIFKKRLSSNFWKWFEKNSELLFNMGNGDEHMFDVIADKLRKVSPYMCFEFGPVEKGKREFVISADGVFAGAQAVIDLVASAPKLDKWTITAFRQRMDIGYIQMNGKKLHVNDIKYSYTFSDDNRVNLKLYIKGYGANRADELMGATAVLMDSVIGEYDAMTKIGAVEFHKPEKNHSAELYQLDELSALLDSRNNNKAI